MTESGAGLVDVCFALGDWGARWLEVAPEHFDAHITLWSIARLMQKRPLPKDRLVVRFDLTDAPTKNRFWMVLEASNPEVCLKNPGFPEDVVVTTTSEWLAKWHMGWITMPQAEREGFLTATGPRYLIRALDTGSKSPGCEDQAGTDRSRDGSYGPALARRGPRAAADGSSPGTKAAFRHILLRMHA